MSEPVQYQTELKEFHSGKAKSEIIELFKELDLHLTYKDGFLFSRAALSMNELLMIDSICTSNKCKFKLIASKKHIVFQIINYQNQNV